MELMIVAALVVACAGPARPNGYDYTPPQHRFQPEYYQDSRAQAEIQNINAYNTGNGYNNYQGNRPRLENGFLNHNTDNGYYYDRPGTSPQGYPAVTTLESQDYQNGFTNANNNYNNGYSGSGTAMINGLQAQRPVSGGSVVGSSVTMSATVSGGGSYPLSGGGGGAITFSGTGAGPVGVGGGGGATVNSGSGGTVTISGTGGGPVGGGGSGGSVVGGGGSSFGGGGGVLGDIRKMPWHAGIYRKTRSVPIQMCGGSLITERVVISAAHCFWRSSVERQVSPSNYSVALGKIYRGWDDPNDKDKQQRSEISRIELPPRYYGSATNYQDDLALVILTTPVQYTEFVNRVILSFDVETEKTQLQSGNPGMVAGWGLTSEDGEPATVLQVVTLPYVPVEQCIKQSPPEFLVSITSDKICAGMGKGTAVCMGDSGGGLVFISQEGNYLRGVVSTAPTNGHLCNIHSWATFTLLSKHERFINDTMVQIGS